MPRNPVLSDLPAVNRRYEPGDCLVVRVASHLTSDQVAKVARSVVKFAGADVSVAVVNVLTTQLMLVRGSAEESIILTPLPKTETVSLPGRANLDLAKVPFQVGDRLHVKTRNTNRQLVENYFKNWTRGKDVEIYVEIVAN